MKIRSNLLMVLPLLFSVGVFAGPPHYGPPAAGYPSLQQGGDQAEAPETEAPAGESAAEEEKWDVSKPPGPSHEVALDVDEGTWLNLDVSPDGREIVFDLLGDIYVIPIQGGDARSLTSGVAWDMQPTYSPDGTRIAFTSDRAGGDNIWVMNRDASDPKQVTKEPFHLLNEPAWAPDGEYIVARKHFTSRRSIGAGEMWLYHRAGGDGLQMTEKANEQKDAGEPVFSPDGRYVYFSQDTTSGSTFQYNKDPNGQIYTIQRLDRESGKVESYVTGNGGSIRPTPSPDGKTLAFIRRVRYKTVLFVKDLESGAETPLFDGLDRDNQETWAIHAVYPRMDWTPDGKSIVFWAKGKFHRIDVASKQVTNIPFRVKDARQVTEVVRFPVGVAPREFDVKMLRWVQVSPKGDQVVYQALGHLWVRGLPNGTPKRLTKQNDHFEFYPQWSRDGRWITYVTWDDQDLGSVRVVSSKGGDSRMITSKPGHYVEPTFSPDGTKVVYRKMGGGFLRSPLWSSEEGIYAVAASGGESKLVTENGVEPQFAADSNRVYYVDFGADQVRELHSIEMDGSDDRTHLTSTDLTEIRLSPDGEWVAFVEKWNVRVAPFVPTGKTVSIGPGGSAVPMATVSRDAGENIHWSGDSSKLFWSLGDELFERELKNAFAFMDGAPEEIPEPAESGMKIGFRHALDVPSGIVALVGARIVTMNGDEVIENGTVVVEGNRIKAVGAGGGVEVPTNAKTIDVSGKTIIPGLIDVHWHGSLGQDEITPQQNWYLYSSLAFGVTTIHDPSNDTTEIFAGSEMVKAGVTVGPRVYSTGTILYGAKGSFKAEIDSLDDARSHLRRLKKVGAISVKSYNQPRRDQRQQVIAAARELEMMVVPEGGSLYQHNMTMVVDGHTGIEHAVPVEAMYDDAKQMWAGTDVGYTPTLIVGYGGIWGEEYWYQKTNVWEDERLLKYTPREYVDSRSRRRTMAPDEEFNHFRNAKVATELMREGVSVQLGAHGQREGLGAHWELWMFGQGGMTAHEALRAATIEGAAYLGMDKDIGSVEVGKLADLVVLNSNPLANLRASEDILYTMVNGRIYKAMEMNEVGNHPKERESFWFDGK